MPDTNESIAPSWRRAILQRLRAYRMLALPVALLVLVALGWYLVIQQNAMVGAAAVSAYQRTELEMARVIARSIERYAGDQLSADEPASIAEVEEFAVARFVEPVHLLTSGGAWLYSPERGLLDSGSGTPYGLAANRVSKALGHGAAGPVASGLVTVLATGSEGAYLLSGSSGAKDEVVAWSPLQVAGETLVVGVAAPLDEILASSGATGQMHALAAVMGLASAASVLLLAAWLRSESRRQESEAAVRRAQQELEQRVLERTAALSEAYQALGESERRYREFADSLPQVVFEANARGDLTFVNRAALDLLGITDADLRAGLSAMSLIAPGDRARVARDMLRVLAGRATGGSEYDLRLGDGTVVPAIVHANAVVRDGRPVGFRGVVIDIRERKAAEEALRESERRFRNMLERVQLFAAILDAEGRIVFCNPCLLQATGWRWEELAGRDWFDCFVPADSRQYLRTRFSQYALPGAEPMRHRVQQLLTRDGGRRTVFWNIIALYDSDGRFTGSASLGEDITERLRAERALQESEERYRTLFNSSSDALFVRAIGGRSELGPLIEVNDTACAMLGYSREELLAMPPGELAIRETPARDWLRLLLERGRALFETNYQTRDGRMLAVEVSSSLMEHRGELAILSTVRDISERRRLEAQLLESRKLESIGRLAGGIAHDFNNILMAITGHASFALEDETMSAEAREELTHLLKAADRAASLTRQLLAFSRQQIIAPRVLQANELISDLKPMLERMIGEKHALELELADDLEPTNADPTQLQQVITNLVVNARDAMPAGGIIKVRSANAELRRGSPLLAELDIREGAYVVISVADTGVGIAEDVRRRIFEPFFTTKALGKGTGMGLPTALGIVKQHRGGIRVDSTPGKGTAFEVYLPTTLAQVDAAEDDATLAGLPTGGETILVVDGDEQARATAVKTLRRLGYCVLQADDSDAAEKMLRDDEARIDMVLAPCRSAASSGHGLVERLVSQRPDLKLLLLAEEAEALAAASGRNGHQAALLARPFTATDLAYGVRRLLDGAVLPAGN